MAVVFSVLQPIVANICNFFVASITVNTFFVADVKYMSMYCLRMQHETFVLYVHLFWFMRFVVNLAFVCIVL
jgi:hypothetical protein